MIGIGVDALEISRMRTAVERTPSLLQRVFTERELASCMTRCGDLRHGGLAARFAAKEALAKALGTGIRGFALRDIEILNDEAGKPEAHLHGSARSAAESRGVARAHVSLSTSHDLAVANVVLEDGSG
ncbi:MAG TPA: holo-ACP synthase [Egibacteraceae bacterium]|nr:holo-ACP synthase [Egibacteraceae bacterium]